MAQHWGIRARYCCVSDTESGALDFLRYQPVADGCGDPAAWPLWAEGRAAAEPVPGWGGCCWCCWAGFSEHRVVLKDLCVWGGGHLGRADKGRPQQAETDPSFTFSMSSRLTISAADTNCLISQLISDSKHRSLQQIPDGGETVEWLIKGGPVVALLNARPQTAARCPPQHCRCASLNRSVSYEISHAQNNSTGCLAAICRLWNSSPALLICRSS